MGQTRRETLKLGLLTGATMTTAGFLAGAQPAAAATSLAGVTALSPSLADNGPTLQAAINAAALDGSGVVVVKAGSYKFLSGIKVPQGVVIRGASTGVSFTFLGTGTFIQQKTPGTRVYSLGLESLVIIGPGKATASVAVDLDSVSTAVMRDVTIRDFGVGWRIRSTISGGAVYNTFMNCTALRCGTGYSIEPLSTNATRFFACRACLCGVGVDVTDSNNTTWLGGQIEENTIGVRVNARGAGYADMNLFDSTRFEKNVTAWVVSSPSVRYTMFNNAMPFGPYAYQDKGTETQFWGGASLNRMGSVTQSDLGSWRFSRSANGGAETPALVVADTVSTVGTPVTLQIETARWNGYFLRGKRAGKTYFDIDALGNIRSPQGGHVELSERSADPAAPPPNGARIFLKANGLGMTQLCVRFATGSTKVISTQT